MAKVVKITETDQELITRYKETGDKSCVGKLYQRYTHLVYGVCMKYLQDEDESKDAVMQIFEKLLVDLKKHQIESFKWWLHSVSKNHCLMFLRNRKSMMQKHHEFQLDTESDMETGYELHLDGVSDKEKMLQALEQAVKELNIEQKICVELFFLKEKSYKEITDLTGYPINEVKSYLQNGKRNLRNYLLKQYEQKA